MRILKSLGLVLLGMALAVGIFCLAVGIGCAVNGLQFGEQICQWFGSHKESAEELGKVLLSLPIKLG